MKSAERQGPVETIYKVEKGIDDNAHFNNVWWGVALEKGRLVAARKLQVDLSMPIQRLCINYDAQIYRGDRLVVATYITQGENSTIFNQGLIREGNQVGSSLSVYASYFLAPDDQTYSAIFKTAIRLRKVFPSEIGALHHLTAPFYFEKGREHFINTKGVSMEKMRKEGLRFVVGILDTQYFQSMDESQEVEIATGLEVDESLFFFQQEMGGEKGVISRADVTCAVIDREGQSIDDPKVIDPIVEQLMDV